MTHAEICPVCKGSGCTDDGKEPRITIDCHGCNGKGWVEVGSDPVIPRSIPYPSPWQPAPCKPEWPPRVYIGD